MFTPKQVAGRLGLSGTTIRNYSRQWSDYLSPAANPEAGQARLYTEDDIAVITTIAALRENQATTDQIRAALDAGQRLAPMRPLEDDRARLDAADQDQQAAADQTRATVEAAAAAADKAIAIYRDRVTTVEVRNQELTDRLIEATARAAAAEKELEVMRQLYEAATATAPGSTRPTFWQWLTGRK